MAKKTDAEERLSFQAEVSRLLDIVAHSLYSNKEIFLRELISNASDACDRLRYAALTAPELLAGEPEFHIRIALDRAERTIEVADNGIGMSRAELIENLGTIARSGTAAFVEELAAARAAGKPGAELSLIGQFGVGFYSAFMVAERVEVRSRKAGEAEAWLWASDGKGSFTVAPVAKEGRGTAVRLTLSEDAKEFLDPARLRHVAKTYSDHIQIPIVLAEGGKEERINAASAIWMRPRAEITPEQYAEFYRHAAHMLDEPWETLHWKVEGTIDCTALLFVPGARPFDTFDPERKPKVKLYVRRVFITDDCPELLPSWLRFLRGVVDSDDLPLNISREMLQQNPVLAKVRQVLIRRTLAALKERAEKDADAYAAFWRNFGAVLKEGLYDEPARAEELFPLCRFASTGAEGPVSLADYAGRMREGQEAIYTIAGEDAEALRTSPQLEGFAAKGVEVLLLTDPIDEFWPEAVGRFAGKPFKSITRGAADLARIKAPEGKEETKGEGAREAALRPEVDALLKALRKTLGEAVKDVRVSERLTASAVCLVADEGEIDIRLERMLRQHRQIKGRLARILEINPGHALIRRLCELAKADGGGAAGGLVAEAAWLLLDQARIVEGEPVADAPAFARRLTGVMEKALGG
ncbi:MAG: molecular chaperone HtpG [Proteobacteria bacterium]|nr:molecular chaperone HtpG [Pseudomonadota bacterium]